MARAEIKLTGPWDDLEASLVPAAWNEALERHVTRAHKIVGLAWQTVARRMINSGTAYLPNSPMTVLLKGSSRPLVDNGDLFQALTYQATTQPGGVMTLRLGVVRGRKGGTDERINIAHILHEGATINVGTNPQVRRKVWAMARDRLRSAGELRDKQRDTVLKAAGVLSTGGGATRSIWVIPSRPFIERPTMDGGFQKAAKKAYTRAVEEALREHFPESEG